MQQLAVAPAWARCTLPDPNTPDADMAYLWTATLAKKSACCHLDRAWAHQGQDSINSLIKYSALSTPRELAQFWRKLNQCTPSIPTLSTMVVKDGVTITYHNATSVLQVFCMYWANLYKVAPPTNHTSKPWCHEHPVPIPPEEIAALMTPISMAEFDHALRSTGCGALGTDGVDVDIINAAPPEALALIHQNMNDVLACWVMVPEEWQKARIILLPKGLVDNPANYCPISLLQVTYKIFTKILTERLAAVANKHILSWVQLGFCKGMSAQLAL